MADPIRVLGLFSGIGGLELAVGAGLARVGREHELVGLVEGEAFGAACLVSAMAAGALDAAPVWLGDVRDFPATAFRGAVDLVCGGFPCQDISSAGKQAGIGGERSSLFFDLERIARDVGARWLFLENVAAITVRGLDQVLGTLADGGWDAEWLHLRASDVGAPHRRERWFCLAERLCERLEGDGAGGAAARSTRRGGGTDVANASDDHGRRGERGEEAGAWPAQLRRRGPASRGAGLPVWPPRPSDAEGWRRVIAARPDLAPALVADRDRAGRRRSPQRDQRATRGQQAQQRDDAHRRGAQGPGQRREGGDGGEAQSEVRERAHGAAIRLDGDLDAAPDHPRAAEAVSSVRNHDEPQAHQRSDGGSSGVQASCVLRPNVHGSWANEARLRVDALWSLGQGSPAFGAALRGLRDYGATLDPSQERELARQLARQPCDAVRFLSQQSPPLAWRDREAEDTARLSRVRDLFSAPRWSNDALLALMRVGDAQEALRNRTDRLRALGNAVVPAQGAAAFVELWNRLHGVKL